jgi:hypothetical protein
MSRLAQGLLSVPRFAVKPQTVDLILALTGRTGQSSAGYPYLNAEGFARIRDSVPLLFAEGLQTYRLLDAIEEEVVGLGASPEERESFGRGVRVVRTMIRTTCVTAPPDLWLLRYVLGAYAECGLIDRLLSGERIDPANCATGSGGLFSEAELRADLGLLLSRGYLYERQGDLFAARHPRAIRVLQGATPLREEMLTSKWSALFCGEALYPAVADSYLHLCWHCPRQHRDKDRGWLASSEEIEIGWRVLPIVLGMRVAGVTHRFLQEESLDVDGLNLNHGGLVRAACDVLSVAGALARISDGVYRVTRVGRRVLERGPGPFGIIEAYQPYMAALGAMLQGKTEQVWVHRAANVAASQDANRKTFEQANDALDRFCASTGFEYAVFIEHALGRGEAIRQRFERDDGAGIRYVGADLEDAAIEAAKAEQQSGNLPADMLFVAGADIGEPRIVLDALAAADLPSQGAVMMVGNGFHEIRSRTDDDMVTVFQEYEQAGIIILFTEESALSVDDLLETAWNTYHAGFKYVHEKSGQRLRPASPGPPNRYGEPLRASWQECASRASYVRVHECCSRSRRVFPYKSASGHNPAISVNHFIIPRGIAEALGYPAQDQAKGV